MGRARIDRDALPSAQLSDGTWARIVPSPFTSGMELEVEDTPQSHVDEADPTHLHFEYIARMGAVIDEIGDAGAPLTCVHLGAGAMTLPRYIAHTRPGSRQQVIELEAALVALVRERLPLPRQASIRVRIGDARERLNALPQALVGAVDLLVVDVFSGAQIPAHLTTREFLTEASGLLTGTGVLLMNIADGGGLRYARAQVATVRAVLAHTLVLAEPRTLKGHFGNLVIAASHTAMPTDRLPRLMAAGPHPATILDEDRLVAFCAGAQPITDTCAQPSPAPAARLFER